MFEKLVVALAVSCSICVSLFLVFVWVDGDLFGGCIFVFYLCCVCLPHCLVVGIVLVVDGECVYVVCFARIKGSVFCVGIYFSLCLSKTRTLEGIKS